MNYPTIEMETYNRTKNKRIFIPFEKGWNSYSGKVKNEEVMFYLVLGYVGDRMGRKIGNLLKKYGFNFLYLPVSKNIGEIRISFYEEDNFRNFVKLAKAFRNYYNFLEKNNPKNTLYAKLSEEYPKISNK